MTHRIRRPVGLVLLFAAVLLLLGMAMTATASADPVKVRGDATRLTVDPAVTQALLDAGIVIQPIHPAKAVPAKRDGMTTLHVTFPITDGMIDPGTLAGQIWHSGGLSFMRVSDGALLEARNFRIDTTEGLLYGLVGDAYVPLLNLDLSAIELGGKFPVVRVANVLTSLTAEAAGALNATFGTELPAGLAFGVARVDVRLPVWGHTEVAIDPAILQALTDAKLGILPVAPALVMPVMAGEPWNGIVGPTLAYRFPITKRDLKGSKQAIWHSGGLRFVNFDANKWIAATKFKIDPVKQNLRGCICGVMSAKLFDLDFSAAGTTMQGPYTVIGPVGLDLTAGAAQLLNERLKVEIFQAGMRVGEAKVVVRI
jgi:hypothetical protein